ncbi:MAG TPA: sulfatase-like hydrolase/transferase [Gemmatimonadaceae bacterium]|nr:sulfatase-like hydrolase/transferase [Gemmatimonadaceae bacterium]
MSQSRRRFLGTLAGGAGAAAGAAMFGASAASARGGPDAYRLPQPSVPGAVAGGQPSRPNIIYIMADDLGYADLSGYGRPDYVTPELDRLASEGVRLTHAYAIAPVCTPTRVGLMTGRYPARHPIGLMEPLRLSDDDKHLGLDPAHPTISSLLKTAGYTNGLFGKWHLGVDRQFMPSAHGFDEHFGPLSGAVDHISHVNTAGESDLYHNGERVDAAGYTTDLVVDHAVRFIERRPEPFFLSLQGTLPHWPWQSRDDPPYPAGRSLRADGPQDRYAAMVQAFDEGVGRILRAIDKAGIADRTLVIFTSDNGGERYSNMGGLARRKGQLWEGGIRVPAFARWPGVLPAGVTLPQVVNTLDWTATMLAAAGAIPSQVFPLDGIDVLPILSGRAPMLDRTVFWRTFQISRQAAARQGTWKYLRDEDGEYLFDLVLDPGERNDLHEQEPARFARLRDAWEAWDAGMLEPIPLGAGAQP